MNTRIRYIPDEILAIFLTAVIGLSVILIIINIARIYAWIQLLPWVD